MYARHRDSCTWQSGWLCRHDLVHSLLFLLSLFHLLCMRAHSHRSIDRRRQHARRAFRADPDDSARDGRLERGRKDRDRHAARQEPHRRVLAARVHLHRRRVPRDPPRARILEWHGRGRQGAFVYFHFSFVFKKQKQKKRPRPSGMSPTLRPLESRLAEIVAATETPSVNYSGRTKATRSAAQELLLSVIVGSISVKAHIVTNDERETTGLRNLVNFGHMIGHAIEAMLTPSILHGECISVGMIIEGEVSRQLGHLGQVSASVAATQLVTSRLTKP